MRRRLLHAALGLLTCLALVAGGGWPHAATAAAPGALLSDSQVGTIQQIVDRQPSEFEGLYADARTHVVTIGVVGRARGDAATRRAMTTIADARSMPNPMAQFETPVWNLAYADVTHSPGELEATRSQVTTRQPWASIAGPYLATWGVDFRLDKVRVGVTRLTPGIAAAARQAFGDRVQLERADRPRLADRRIDAQPFWGGDDLGVPRGDFIILCTASFAVVAADLGRHGMLTAGHCYLPNETVQQGFYDRGSQTWNQSSAGPLGVVARRVYGSGDSDGEYLDAPAAGADTVGDMFTNGPPNPSAFQTVVGDGQEFQGLGLCLSGGMTNENCNAVLNAINVCVNTQDDQGNVTQVCHESEADSTDGTGLCQSGDSGGPVYGYGGGGVFAFGTISSGNAPGTQCFYSQLSYLEGALNIALQTIPSAQAANQKLKQIRQHLVASA